MPIRSQKMPDREQTPDREQMPDREQTPGRERMMPGRACSSRATAFSLRARDCPRQQTRQPPVAPERRAALPSVDRPAARVQQRVRRPSRKPRQRLGPFVRSTWTLLPSLLDRSTPLLPRDRCLLPRQPSSHRSTPHCSESGPLQPGRSSPAAKPPSLPADDCRSATPIRRPATAMGASAHRRARGTRSWDDPRRWMRNSPPREPSQRSPETSESWSRRETWTQAWFCA